MPIFTGQISRYFFAAGAAGFLEEVDGATGVEDLLVDLLEETSSLFDDDDDDVGFLDFCTIVYLRGF